MYTGIGAQSDILQDPPYLQHYGLVRDPFSLAIENDFFYENPARSQNLDLLHHVTLSNELLMLVSGAHGIGKSSLLHRFIARANESWKICLINANSMLFEEQFLRQVFRGFGLAVPAEGGTNEYLKKLGEQLEDMQREGEIALLIIDDAHELPTPTLQFLARLYELTHDDRKSLRIIMFAEQQIENILPSAGPLKQSITHTLELAPLSEKETAEYIKHRMMVAGFNSNTPAVFAYPFTDTVISRIYKSSHGLPSQINKHAGQILLDMSRGSGAREQPVSEQKPGRKFPAFTILAAILVAVTLVVMLAVQDTINELFTPSSTGTHRPDAAKDTTSADAAKPGVIQRMQREPVMALPEEEAAQTPAIIEPDITSAETGGMVEHATTVAPSESDMLARSAARQDAAANTDIQNALPPKTSADTTAAVPALREDSARASQIVGKPAAVQSTPAKPSHAGTPAPAEKTAPAGNVPPTKDEAVVSATTPSPEVIDKQTEWLYAQNPGHYTLQLLSTHNRATIDKFVAANRLEDKAVTLKSQRKDGDWYLLLYGAYPDAAAAKTSSAQLEQKKNFAGVKPWPRAFAALQANLLGKKITPPAKTATPKTAVKPITSTAPVIKPAPKPGTKEWLLAQNPWAYTIQLIGSQDRTSINQFIKQHNLDSNKAVYFRTLRDNSDWYILIYGIYTSEQDARDAISKLPASLRRSSPWLRPVASVHADILRSTPPAR